MEEDDGPFSVIVDLCEEIGIHQSHASAYVVGRSGKEAMSDVGCFSRHSPKKEIHPRTMHVHGDYDTTT